MVSITRMAYASGNRGPIIPPIWAFLKTSHLHLTTFTTTTNIHRTLVTPLLIRLK
jgi:hypothetical protein